MTLIDPTAEAPLGVSVEREAPQGRSALRRLASRPTFVIGVTIMVFWVVMAIAWRWITPQDPFATSLDRSVGPGIDHWFGTDRLGRDVFARVLAGAESVLLVAPLATLLSTVVGSAIGLVAAYRRGWVDEVTMRVLDTFTSFPAIITAVLALSLLGRTSLNLILVIAAFFVPLVARTVRAAALVEREKQYVEAARLRGEGAAWVLGREILPNIAPTIVVEATVRLAFAVFASAALSFLQLGPAIPSPDWGLSIAVDRAYLQIAWWTVLFPSLAIASLVISVNLVADNLQEVLDP